MKRLPYADAEKKCAVSFLGHGDWWHLYTPGNLTELLFRDDDDYRYVMNLMARCLAEVPGLAVVAFEVMSNCTLSYVDPKLGQGFFSSCSANG